MSVFSPAVQRLGTTKALFGLVVFKQRTVQFCKTSFAGWVRVLEGGWGQPVFLSGQCENTQTSLRSQDKENHCEEFIFSDRSVCSSSFKSLHHVTVFILMPMLYYHIMSVYFVRE